MKYQVNFYIHIYNHPMYIVKNFDKPLRNIHLSYHDGEHYNSIRLKDDTSDDVPQKIPLDIINFVEQTTNSKALNENKEDEENDDRKDEDELKSSHSQEEAQNEIILNDKDESQEISVNGVIIKDIKEKPQKYQKCIITTEGIIYNELSDFKKCHCESNKKYKSCCSDKDIKGEYNKSENIFYSNLDVFKSKINIDAKSNGKNENNTEDSVNPITKKLEKIFI